MTKRAIIHVENTENVLELAEYLSSSGWTIVSANKTEEFLRKNKIPVVREPSLVENSLYQADTTQLIKDLISTKIMEEESYIHQGDFESNNIYLVCINLNTVYNIYANSQQLSSIMRPSDFYISNILRSAFTNFENIIILTDPNDYKEALIQLKTDNVSKEFRCYLAAKALNMSSAYDAGISASILFNQPERKEFMNYLMYPFQKGVILHNGSNKHQNACLYRFPQVSGATAGMLKLSGKDLDSSIVTDVSQAWEEVSLLYSLLKNQLTVKSINSDGYEFTTQFTPLTGTVFTVVFKYNSLLGAALSTSVEESFKKTYNYDSQHITDEILGCSSVIDEPAAKEIVKTRIAAIIAPDFTEEAKHILTENSKIKLISTSKVQCSPFNGNFINGGFILQTNDLTLFKHWHVRTKNRPSQFISDQFAFGTLLLLRTRSYSCILLKEHSVEAIAQGRPSYSQAFLDIELQLKNKSNENKDANILVCDAPISFGDEVKHLIDLGVQAILQPGGTPTDQEFINYCDDRGIVMVFTDMSHINL